MCGIAGAWEFGKRPDDEFKRRLRRMTLRLHHRGPDAQDAWVGDEEAVGLGHARLAIIDLTPTGAQPMRDPQTGNVLILNGEIYNFAELRRTLEARGHVFRGRSDTQALLLGYAEWGEAVLDRLNGMFAFALWDARRRSLF